MNEVHVEYDSFWHPGGFKKTTKRIEDGYKLCNDLIDMIEERADISKSYARSLQNWSKKWNESLNKSGEYGTMADATKGLFKEADRLAVMHLNIKKDLLEDVAQNVRLWQKDNYHKRLVHIQQRKDMERAFRKIEKPWCHLLEYLNKAKTDYFNCCKNEQTAVGFQRNAAVISSLSSEQVKKIEDRVSKAKLDVRKAKEKYLLAQKDLDKQKNRYIIELKTLFDKCQSKECQRLQFFKETLFHISKKIDVSKNPSLPKIYDSLFESIDKANHESDLKWWSENYGTDMKVEWPKYEEFSGQIENKVSKFFMNLPTTSRGRDANESDFEESTSEEVISTCGGVDQMTVKVKALYDYNATAADELTLHQGDEFDRLGEQDDLGWCTGRKNGVVGLYPGSYAKPI